MHRVVGVLLALLLFSEEATAQYAYNPRAVEFEHSDEDFNKSIAYTAEFWNETETTKLFEFSVQRADVETTGEIVNGLPVRRIAWEKFRQPAIGTSYKIRLLAVGDPAQCPDGLPCVSAPSNFAPNLVRLSACYNRTTMLNQPVVVTFTGPSSVRVGAHYVLSPGQLTVTGPSPVVFLSIDAQADGYPAQYFTLTDLRSGPPPVIGPFRRTGNFALLIRVVDDRGCEGTHATPYPRIVVTP